MKHIKLIGVIIAVCLLFGIIVGIVLQNSNPSVIPDDEMDSIVSEILADKTYEKSESTTQIESSYLNKAKFGNYVHSVDTPGGGTELSLEEINENIADVQNRYLAFLEICQSEENLETAKSYYERDMTILTQLRSIKTRTPEVNIKLHEQAFYEYCNRAEQEFTSVDEDDPLSELYAQKLDTIRRAKKYYEDGTITIDQACQAVGISSLSLTYDETFSLPE